MSCSAFSASARSATALVPSRTLLDLRLAVDHHGPTKALKSTRNGDLELEMVTPRERNLPASNRAPTTAAGRWFPAPSRPRMRASTYSRTVARSTLSMPARHRRCDKTHAGPPRRSPPWCARGHDKRNSSRNEGSTLRDDGYSSPVRQQLGSALMTSVFVARSVDGGP